LRFAIRVASLAIAASPAWAQCSLCKLAVEQDPSLGTAFNKAILLLMFPALGVFAGVFLLAIRSSPDSRRKSDEDKSEFTE
jgi:hypothetical protein